MRDKLISNKSILMKQLKETGRLEKFRKKYIPTEEEVKTVTNMVSDMPLFTKEKAVGAFPIRYRELPGTYIILEYMPLASYLMRKNRIPLPRIRIMSFISESQKQLEVDQKECIFIALERYLSENKDEDLTLGCLEEKYTFLEARAEALVAHTWMKEFYHDFDLINLIDDQDARKERDKAKKEQKESEWVILKD